MERNEQLFRDVADAIEREPRRYDQRFLDIPTDCGTAHCIAGWGRVLATWEHSGYEVHALFGLTEDEAWGDYDRSGLFCSYWRPHDGLSVPDALREIGEGAAIEDVSA